MEPILQLPVPTLEEECENLILALQLGHLHAADEILASPITVQSGDGVGSCLEEESLVLIEKWSNDRAKLLIPGPAHGIHEGPEVDFDALRTLRRVGEGRVLVINLV